MKLILDIGNTRMKAAVIDSGTVVECTAGAEPQSLQTERLCSQYGIEGAIDLDKAKMGKNAISKITRKPGNKGK